MMERLCYVMRSIIKHVSDALVSLKGIILFEDVILSLRRIWRGADVQFARALVALRARSFGTEVPQDDACGLVLVGNSEKPL